MGQRSKLELALALVAILSAAVHRQRRTRRACIPTARTKRDLVSRSDAWFCIRVSPPQAATIRTSFSKLRRGSLPSSCAYRAISTSPPRAPYGKARARPTSPNRKRSSFAVVSGHATTTSSTDGVPDNVGGDAHVDFAYNPSKVFTLAVRDTFLRNGPTVLQSKHHRGQRRSATAATSTWRPWSSWDVARARCSKEASATPTDLQILRCRASTHTATT